MAEFVMFELDDGSQVYFEAAENDLVARHAGTPDVHEAGPIARRLEPVAAAAAQVADSLREKLSPDEVTLQFGVKVSGEVNWWFFAKNQAEATINVTLAWRQPERGRVRVGGRVRGPRRLPPGQRGLRYAEARWQRRQSRKPV